MSELVQLTDPTGAVVGTVTTTATGATGEVEFAGQSRAFRAEPAVGSAGVYRLAGASPGRPWTGWVVLNDGSITGTAKGKPRGSTWICPDTEP